MAVLDDWGRKRVDEKEIGDPLEVVAQLLRSSEVASATRCLGRQVFFKTCADFFVAQRLAALHLRQAFLDFTHEPIVVVDQPFDGFTGQRLRDPFLAPVRCA